MREIVIKIPDSIYQKVNDGEADEFTSAYVVGAVSDGIPLPKGHGRLIDADDLWDAYQDLDYDFYEAMDVAKTILEADEEGENGK